MKILLSSGELKKVLETRGAQIPCECQHCGKTFYIKKRNYNIITKGSEIGYKGHFCSLRCAAQAREKKEWVKCKQCGKEFYKKRFQCKKHPNNFCCSSCAATYNNMHKKIGIRRSKLEIYLEKRLSFLYPNLKILYNDKAAINSELDIYISSLQLAFELNGIFHYEPIYGNKKLNQTQNNDERKFQACAENGISLCIIDTSQQKHFTEKSSQKYLKIICDIIDEY